jgi:hypothetical protein
VFPASEAVEPPRTLPEEPKTILRRTSRVALLIVVALAAWLRLRALAFGLPYPFAAVDEHLVTDHALAFTAGDWNPRYFAYPSFVFALHALAYLVAGWLGPWASLAAMRADYWVDPAPLLLVSRALTVAVALFTVWAAARLAAELARACGWRGARRLAGVVGALAVATSALHASNSRWTTVDLPMVAAATLGLALALRHLRRGGAGTAAGAAVAVGIAAGSKYYGALFALAVGVVVAARAWREGGGRAAAKRLAVAAVWTIGAFVASSPFVVLDFATFAHDFKELRAHMEGGHFGHDPTRSGAAVYGGLLLGRFVGAWLSLPALLGALIALLAPARRLPRDARIAAAALLLPAAVHFALIAQFRAQPVDYLLGLLPGLAAFAALAVVAVAAAIAQRTSARAGVAAAWLLAAPLAFGAHYAWDEGSWLARRDSRVAAREWIEAHVAPGALLASDSWIALPLTVDCLEAMRTGKVAGAALPDRRGRDEPLAALDAKLADARAHPGRAAWDFAYLTKLETDLRDDLFPLLREHGCRWLVLDGSHAARAARSGGELTDLAEWYRRHMAGPRVVARFDPADGVLSGPSLVVLDLDR